MWSREQRLGAAHHLPHRRPAVWRASEGPVAADSRAAPQLTRRRHPPRAYPPPPPPALQCVDDNKSGCKTAADCCTPGQFCNAGFCRCSGEGQACTTDTSCCSDGPTRLYCQKDNYLQTLGVCKKVGMSTIVRAKGRGAWRAARPIAPPPPGMASPAVTRCTDRLHSPCRPSRLRRCLAPCSALPIPSTAAWRRRAAAAPPTTSAAWAWAVSTRAARRECRCARRCVRCRCGARRRPSLRRAAAPHLCGHA